MPSYFIHFPLFTVMWFKHGLKYNPKMARFGICPEKNRANVESSVVRDGWKGTGIVSPLRGSVFVHNIFLLTCHPYGVGVNADVF